MRILQVAGLLLAVAAGAWCEQAKAPAKAASKGEGFKEAPKGNNAKGGVRPEIKGGVPKSVLKGGKLGPPVINPKNPLVRLYKSSPEERERAIEKLNPQMQERLRRQLEAFDRLPKEQQEAEIRLVERFNALPPEKKQAFEAQWAALIALPRERQGPVRQAIRRLQPMTEDERNTVLNRPQFRDRFSPEELKIISALCTIIPSDQ